MNQEVVVFNAFIPIILSNAIKDQRTARGTQCASPQEIEGFRDRSSLRLYGGRINGPNPSKTKFSSKDENKVNSREKRSSQTNGRKNA